MALAACGDDGSSASADPSSSSSGAGGADLPPIYDGPAGEYVDVTPCPLPSAWPLRTELSAAVFDSIRERVVLLTVSDTGGQVDLHAWQRAERRFERILPCGTDLWFTPTRDEMTGAYDAASDTYVFLQGATFDPHTIVYDPIAGTVEDITEMPFECYAHGDQATAAAFDEARGRVIGIFDEAICSWDAASKTWEPEVPLSATLPRPSVRGFDHGRGKLYVIPIDSTAREVDLDTGVVTQRAMGSTLPGGSIEFRRGIFDPIRDRMIIHQYSTDGSSETIEWSPLTSTLESRGSSTGVDAPSSAPIVFDAGAGVPWTISASELDPAVPYVADVWTWTGSAWNSHRPERLPFAAPDTLKSSVLEYDAARKRVVSAGFTSDGTGRVATLEWDGTSWLDRTPPAVDDALPTSNLWLSAWDAGSDRLVYAFPGDGFYGLAWWDGAERRWDVGDATTGSDATALWFDRVRSKLSMLTSDGAIYEWNEGTASLDQLTTGSSLDQGSCGLSVYDPRTRLLVSWCPPYFWRGLRSGAIGSGYTDPIECPSSVVIRGLVADTVRGTIEVFAHQAGDLMSVYRLDPVAGTCVEVEAPALLLDPPGNAAPARFESASYDAERETLVLLTSDGRIFERRSKAP